MVLGNRNELRKCAPECLDGPCQCEVGRTVTNIQHSARQPEPRAHLLEELHKTLDLQEWVVLSAFDRAWDALPIYLRTAHRVGLRELGEDRVRTADLANVARVQLRLQCPPQILLIRAQGLSSLPRSNTSRVTTGRSIVVRRAGIRPLRGIECALRDSDANYLMVSALNET